MNNIQNKKRVYMVLDSQRRELDSRLLFISKCLSKNYEVTLSSKTKGSLTYQGEHSSS